MGLLDDAIREHLDLKRRRGGDPEEIERLEREALGPVRREPPPMPGSRDQLAAREPPLDDEDYDEHPATVSDAGAAGLPGPAAPQHDPFDDEDYDDSEIFGEQPTQMHSTEAHEEEPVHRRFGLFGRKSSKADQPAERELAEEPEIRRPEPERHYEDDEFDDDDPFAHDDDSVDPIDRTPVADDEPERPGLPSLNFQQQDETSAPPRRPRFSDLADEASAPSAEGHADEPDRDNADPQAASTAESARHDDWDEKTQLFELDDEAPVDEPADAEDDEDVLEGTPDFLQDTPEHDRLWFEQKPPRDFDFDG